MRPNKESFRRRGFFHTIQVFLVVCLVACSSSEVQEGHRPEGARDGPERSARPVRKASEIAAANRQTSSAPISGISRLALKFDPPKPVTGDTLRITMDPTGGGEPLDLVEVRWTVNGIDLEKTGEILEHDLHYGDSVTATVELVGTDGRRPKVSASVFVGNAAPSLALSGETLKSGEYSASIDVQDPEGDPVEVGLLEGPEGMFWDASRSVLEWRPLPEQKGVFPVWLQGRDSSGNVCELRFNVTVTNGAATTTSRQGVEP